MTPLLKSLLGNGPKDQELAEEMRVTLREMKHERARYEALLESTRTATERLQQLNDPIAKAGSEVDAVASRLGEVEQRFAAMVQLAMQLQPLDERLAELSQHQAQAQAQIATTLQDTQQVRAVFEELREKVDVAVELKERLGSFLEVEKPFQQLRGDAEAVRGQVDGVSEHMARLREQHDRLMDTHKLAMSKMEALDRRRDDLGRSLTDKERRIVGVEQAVRGMDGVQQTVDAVKRDIGTLKALGDAVMQKTAALEAQRDAVDRALAQADHLDRAMRQIDAGVRQQQENEKSLAGLQDNVVALRSLHETAVERAGEVAQLMRDADEQTRATRQDLASVTDEMRKTVERFDFEGRALESVSQRVGDLRAALTDCETRFKGLNEPSLAVGQLTSQAKSLSAHLQTLSGEVGHVDQEMERFQAIRRDLDETARIAREVSAQLARIDAARPSVEATLHDLGQLGGAHAMVKEALEHTQVVHAEVTRMRGSQTETKAWLADVELLLGEQKSQVAELSRLQPTIEAVQKQANRLGESTAALENRQEFLDGLHRRLAELGALGGKLDERVKGLKAHMDAADQQFETLSAQAEEAERLSTTMSSVSARMGETERKSEEIAAAVSSIAARCESVEELAEETRALKPQLEQRQKALTEATKNLERVTALRKEAASSSHKLGELTQRLTEALATADERASHVDDLSTRLEDRAAFLRNAEKRLAEFEERLSRWDPVEKEIARSLEQMAARQGTIETLQVDLERMFAMVEKTAADVREITSAQQEIEHSRQLLMDTTSKMQEVWDTAKTLDERKRQMGKAEERLARADALVVEVRSSLESLQGQKALVEQAVERVGSLQFLLKQAEGAIEGLRVEREMTSRVRAAVATVRDDEDDLEDATEEEAASKAKAA